MAADGGAFKVWDCDFVKIIEIKTTGQVRKRRKRRDHPDGLKSSIRGVEMKMKLIVEN